MYIYINVCVRVRERVYLYISAGRRGNALSVRRVGVPRLRPVAVVYYSRVVVRRFTARIRPRRDEAFKPSPRNFRSRTRSYRPLRLFVASR